MPTVFENNEWHIALLLTKAVDKAGKANPAFTQDNSLSSNPQTFMHKDLTVPLVSAYGSVEERDRKIIDEILGLLGSQGIEVLSKVLTDCDNRQTHKSATEALIRQGQTAQQWVIKMLGNADDQPWFLVRNALMILRFVGQSEKGIDRARL